MVASWRLNTQNAYKQGETGQIVGKFGHIGIFLLLLCQSIAHAQSVCAEVKIEIPQAASLERQGFNAKLGIENGVAQPILQFDVDLEFKDAQGNVVEFTSDPNNTTAKFFLQLVKSATCATDCPM